MIIRHNGIAINYRDMSVTHRGFTYRQNSQRWKGYNFKTLELLILGAPVTRQRLFEHVYGLPEDGGPIDGVHVFDIRICILRPILKKLQLDLTKFKRAGEQYFGLVPHADVA